MAHVAVRRILLLFALVVAAGLVFGTWLFSRRRQRPDLGFDARVAQPAFTGTHPRLLFDEGHHNTHAALGTRGTYDPFLRLVESDGFAVTRSRARFDRATLRGADVLVIANAIGAPLFVLPSAKDPAFTDAEADAVRDWVRDGGALLLVADHTPVGAANAALAARFGVDMGTGLTYDDPHSDWKSGSPSWLVFVRDTGARILDHPVTDGRDSTERVRRVVTFTGQSLQGPPGSTGFLALASTARDRLPDGTDRAATGRAQGVALTYGRGRVVVLGEAAMLSAQVAGTGARSRNLGMNWPGTDDKQLALNIVRWLAGAY